MGTAEDSFIDLTERIGRKTGGLSVSPSVMSKRGSEEPIALITVGPAALGGTPHAHPCTVTAALARPAHVCACVRSAD